MKKINKTIAAVDIAECALFVAMMVAGAFISIPMPLVPLTFQTVISVLAGLILGPKKGAASMAVYCIMGLIGIPVFTNMGGGIMYVLRPTFGYILGFIVGAAVGGVIAGKKGLPLWRYIVGALVAFLTDYAIGVPYCLLVQHFAGAEDLLNLLVMWNLIYMPKDVVLSILAAFLAWKVLPVIDRGRQKLTKKDL